MYKKFLFSVFLFLFSFSVVSAHSETEEKKAITSVEKKAEEVLMEKNLKKKKEDAEFEDGEIVKAKDSPHVYVIKNGKKVKIKSPKEFEEKGYRWEDIRETRNDLLEKIAELKAEIRELRAELKKQGTLIRNPNRPEVYVITKDGKKVKIKSPKEFKEKGYRWQDIKEVTDQELSQIGDFNGGVPTAVALSKYPNGTLIKAKDSPNVYVIVNGKKRKIPNPATFNRWGYKWEKIKEIEQSEEDDIEEISLESELVRAEGDWKIYRIIGDKKIWIPTIEAFLNSGYRANSEKVISKEELDNFEDVRYVKKGKKLYEIKDGKKHEIEDDKEIEDEAKELTDAELDSY